MTFGAFDLLHPGHLMMLAEARHQCDYLIVGLHTNPQIERPEKNKPVQTTLERYLQLKACKDVSEVIPYDTEEDLYNMLTLRMPDVRIIGEEYQHTKFTGYDLPIEVYFNKRRHSYSSSELRRRLAS